MKRIIITSLLFLAVAPVAQAWNNKGHMVVARIAWKELAVEDRAKVMKILEVHPHLEEFLKDRRPANSAEDEWIFLRCATWPDWVRSGPASRRKFHHGPWHYTNIPFVPPGSKVNPPRAAKENVVKQISDCTSFVKAGSREDAAVHMCWLSHLIGDIHQPMHCITLFNEDFPNGDRGGNRSLIRIDGRVVQMHHFWDGLLGTSTTRSQLSKTVLEIEKLVDEHPTVIANDLKNNLTPESWAKESFELGKRLAYRNGALRPANTEDDPADADIPNAPDDYAEEAGETARYCAAKAGKRLAMVIREVVAVPIQSGRMSADMRKALLTLK